jgi:hypothetical protein
MWMVEVKNLKSWSCGLWSTGDEYEQLGVLMREENVKSW